MPESAFDFSRHVPGQAWRARAACKGMDPDVWFDDNPTHAKTICAGCPVRDDCLDFAQTNFVRDGVYGGYTEAERRKLRRRKRGPRPIFMREGDGDARHGSVNGYVNQKCRCPECCAAKAVSAGRVTSVPR